MHCIQKNFLKPDPVVEGVEDCLYLNVYRPKVSFKMRQKNVIQILSRSSIT